MRAENNIRYDAAYLERYRRGELSPAEAHALEKASLDDPLLAEALEGFYASSRSSEVELDFLHRWVDDRGAENQAAIRFLPKNRSLAPLLRVAAVLLVLVGAAWMSYIFWLTPSAPVLADLPAKRIDTTQVVTESGTVQPNQPTPAPTPPATQPPTVADSDIASTERTDAKEAKVPYAPPALEDLTVTKTAAEMETDRQTSVVSAQADAVINTESTALKAKSEKRLSDKLITSDLPSPSGGWDAYEDYLNRNRVVAPTASNTITNPTVVLSFQLTEQGRPTDIKVERSAGIFYDEKAIELLKIGPPWTPGNNKKRGELQVRF